MVGIYKTHSKGTTDHEILGGALVVPSIEAITKGKGGLEAFPIYGFLRTSVSFHDVNLGLGKGTLKLSAEAALSAKEFVAPTSTALDFNAIYDIVHGAQPDIPAAVKLNAALTYTY